MTVLGPSQWKLPNGPQMVAAPPKGCERFGGKRGFAVGLRALTRTLVLKTALEGQVRLATAPRSKRDEP
jgi:hypothetical protein